MYCDDSSIKASDPKQVVVRKFYYFLILELKELSNRAKRPTCCFTKERKHKLHNRLLTPSFRLLPKSIDTLLLLSSVI